jgi:hypothetical protein
MLIPETLEAWCNQIAVPPHGRALIDRIRTSNPARRVGGGRSNVRGRYPSRKMGVTIQFESHRVELAGIYEMEYNPEVLEFLDQPIQIKLNYEGTGGKRLEGDRQGGSQPGEWRYARLRPGLRMRAPMRDLQVTFVAPLQSSPLGIRPPSLHGALPPGPECVRRMRQEG